MDVFFGPCCDYAAAPVGRQLHYWQLPMLTAGAIARDFAAGKRMFFDLITRVGTSVNSLLDFLLEVRTPRPLPLIVTRVVMKTMVTMTMTTMMVVVVVVVVMTMVKVLVVMMMMMMMMVVVVVTTTTTTTVLMMMMMMMMPNDLHYAKQKGQKIK